MQYKVVNIDEYFNYVPNAEKLIKVSFETSNASNIIPWYSDGNPVICIYGVAETTVNERLKLAKMKADEIVKTIKRSIPSDELWDIEIKPVFLFDTEANLLDFFELANSLDDEAYSEMIDKMQLKYNEPWEKVAILDCNEIQRIIKNMRGDFTCD